MSRLDQRATVLAVACLTEDRSGDEQRAMIDEALALDLARGAFTSTNRPWTEPCLLAGVLGTYDPDEGRRVAPTRAQVAQYERLRAKWERCVTCGTPMGAHPAVGCAHGPADVERVAAIRWAPRYVHPPQGAQPSSR